MKVITANDFGGGMSSDIYASKPGEFSQIRNFDTLTYPNRLYPLPSMASDTASTGVQNMIVVPDSNNSNTLTIFGSGYEPNTTNGSLWRTTGSGWAELTNARSGDAASSDLLIYYPENGNSGRTLIYAGYGATSRLTYVHPDGATALAYKNLAQTAAAGSISQGYIHPADNILYFGYSKANTATYIVSKDASSDIVDPALTLPAKYTVRSLNKYGNYLAIGVTAFSVANVPGAGVETSGIFLWDRTTASIKPNEFIPLGDVQLFALNNLDGVLVACCTYQDNDSGSLITLGYAGGVPEKLTETIIVRQVATETPTFTAYPRVNLIYRKRMYFSMDLSSGATSPIYKGLWSLGRNKKGQWVVQTERFGSTDGTDSSIIAAAFRIGRLFTSTATTFALTTAVQSPSGWATEYASSSYYESVVNPNMPELDKMLSKQLAAALCTFIIPSTGQVVLKYRIDSVQTGAWTTLFTKTATTPTTSLQSYEAPIKKTGTNFEFRIECTGGAQVTAFAYKYLPTISNI